MIDFKIYSNINLKNCEKKIFKNMCYSLKESALIGGLNGSVSGAIAAILAAYGYIALPGFGPIIAMGISVALPVGTVIGAVVGSIIGTFIGTFCIIVKNLYTS